ncbi:MAG: TolC family protein [Bacteroidota bacterium]
MSLTTLLFLLFLAAPALAQVPQDTLPLLTPDEVAARVLAQNPTVLVARLERAIAERDATLGNAGFLPTLSLDATQRRVPTRPDLSFRTDNYLLDASANARVTVFEGLARFARYRGLQAQARARAFDAEATAERVLADALVTYYDVARQQEQLRVLREAVALSDERLRIADGRRTVGAASELEVRRALVDLNADRAALLRQENVLTQSKAFLAQLLDRPGAAFRVADSIAVDRALALAALEDAALASSPDLRAAEASVEASEETRTAVRRELWPRLDLTAGYALSDVTDPLLPPAQAGGFSYGFTATFDLFDANDRRRRLGNADLRTQQQEALLGQARTALLTSLASTHTVYRRSLALVALEEENVEAARQNVTVALERFRLGVSTSLELREVQRALTDTQSRRAAARFEAKQAEIELRTLSSGLLPR